jgi:O-antigen/teichoic acid export membrane protein
MFNKISKSRSISNFFFVAISTGINAIINFAIIPLFAKYMLIEDIGIITTFQSLTSLIVILSTLLIDKSIYRIYHDYTNNEYLSTIFYSGIITTVVILIVSYYFLLSVNFSIFKIIFEKNIIIHLLVISFISFVISITLIILQVIESFFLFSIYSILSVLVPNIFFLIGIFKNPNIQSFYNYGAFGYFILFILSLYFISYRKNLKFKFKLIYLKKSYTYILPILPYMLATWFISMGDRLIIGKYISYEDLAYYGTGVKMASILSVISGIFFNVYNPKFYKLANITNFEINKKILTDYNDFFLLIISIILPLFIILIPFTIALLFNVKFIPSIFYAKYFLIIFYLQQIQTFYTLYLNQSKRSLLQSTVLTISSITTFVFYIIYIKIYGINSLIYINLIITFIVLFVLQKISKTSFYLQLNKKTLILAFLYIIAEIIVIEFKLNSIFETIISTLFIILIIFFNINLIKRIIFSF